MRLKVIVVKYSRDLLEFAKIFIRNTFIRENRGAKSFQLERVQCHIQEHPIASPSFLDDQKRLMAEGEQQTLLEVAVT